MPCLWVATSLAHPMAKARSKKKAKSTSKAKSSKKAALKKKPALKAKSVKAKKAAPKKPVAKKAPKKPRNLVGTAKPIMPYATPVSRPAVEKKALAPEVNRALMQAEVDGLISRLPPPVQPVVKTLRRLVLEAAPEASELLDDGSPAFFANGVFARIVPSERTVLVKFLRGGHLPSAHELIGDGETRSLSLSSLEELKETVLRKLVREAVMLNMSTPVTVLA